MNKHVSTLKYKEDLIEKQYSSLKNPACTVSRDELIKDREKYLNPLDLSVLNILITHAYNHRIVFPSQSLLAQQVNIHERTVRKVITRLKALGLITTFQRWNDSLLYKVSNLFLDCEVRRAFAPVCSALKFLCVLSLFSPAPLAALYHGLQADLSSLLGKGRLENNYIYNSPSVSCTGENNYEEYFEEDASKTERRETGREKDRKRTESRRATGMDSDISPVIRNLKTIPLTQWGQIKLSAFPDEAILYAENQLKKSKMPSDPFAWFFVVCKRYCEVQSIRLNWSHVDQLKIKHSMPENAPMIFKLGGEIKKQGEMNGVVATHVPQHNRSVASPPVRRVLTREEQISEARTLLSLPASLGFEKIKSLFDVRVKEIPEDILKKAQELGAAEQPSAQTIEARIAARLSKSSSPRYAPQTYTEITKNLTLAESYSNFDTNTGGDEEV